MSWQGIEGKGSDGFICCFLVVGLAIGDGNKAVGIKKDGLKGSKFKEAPHFTRPNSMELKTLLWKKGTADHL